METTSVHKFTTFAVSNGTTFVENVSGRINEKHSDAHDISSSDVMSVAYIVISITGEYNIHIN